MSPEWQIWPFEFLHESLVCSSKVWMVRRMLWCLAYLALSDIIGLLISAETQAEKISQGIRLISSPKLFFMGDWKKKTFWDFLLFFWGWLMETARRWQYFRSIVIAFCGILEFRHLRVIVTIQHFLGGGHGCLQWVWIPFLKGMGSGFCRDTEMDVKHLSEYWVYSIWSI